jgi:hypothetical protein
MKPDATIAAPEFPPSVDWLGAPFVRMNTLLGRSVVLVWFWDCCSLNALRALPYVREWNSRYFDAGLRVLGVHSQQFDFGGEASVVEDAVRRLGIEFPVAIDRSYEIWRLYGNEVWPALYLWERRGVLSYYHFGEGAYEDTEIAIQGALQEIDDSLELLEPMAPVRDTDDPDALVQVPTPHVYMEEDRSGRDISAGDELSVRYLGAGATAVLDGRGEVELRLDGQLVRTIGLHGPRLYDLVEHGEHEEHELRLRFLQPARAYAFSFAPGPA